MVYKTGKTHRTGKKETLKPDKPTSFASTRITNT